MELSNKLNYINNNNNNNDIYIKLIKNFENHLISKEKKEAIYNYMKNYTEKNFSNDIIFILEDYNNIISQSIQAIKSLLAENERLNENNFLQNNLNYSNQNFSNNNNNNYVNNNNNSNDEVDSIRINIHNSKTIDGANLKKPLREIFKNNLNKKNVLNKNVLNKNIDNNNIFNNENKFEIIQKNFKNDDFLNKNMKMNKSNENIINKSFLETQNNKKEKIEKIKITNEILKKINTMNKNKLYFTNKYIQHSKNENLEENYKILLNKIINYNLDIRSLIEINSDLIKFQTKNKKNNNNNNQKKINYSPFILEPNESKEFKSNLRIYNNEKTNQKPFLNYTNPYGQLFS